MLFAFISFIAGVLTVLAPCVLPLLPVIIGSSVSGTRKSKPFIIALSLSVSVIVFTFLLKVSTVLIDIPEQFWKWISGGVIILFGVSMLLPSWWENMTLKFNLIVGRRGNKLLAEGVSKESIKGDVLIGAALGPVFSTCSPTYFVILATVLPESFFVGLTYLIAYVFGLSFMLLLISLVGQKVVSRLEGVSNPHGKFKRTLGILFLLVGIFVIGGLDKKIQTFVVQNDFFDITKVEEKLLKFSLDDESPSAEINSEIDKERDLKTSTTTKENIHQTSLSPQVQTKTVQKSKLYPKFIEIKDPSGFVNSEPFILSDYIGKKVILVDFMTYSCINCQRTFPYLKTWYETYEKDGLLIVGIHTPEFAFEKKKENVEEAMKEFGLTFPVVLDNEYGTWRAFKNNFWPRKYLIDIDGFIVYDHIGEGQYEETEQKIKEALKERAERLGEQYDISKEVSSKVISTVVKAQSPETYFGAFRNTNFANGEKGKVGEATFTELEKEDILAHKLYLTGTWNIQNEFAKAVSGAKVFFRFEASKVFIVASSSEGGVISVYKDGVFLRNVSVKDSKLYTLFDESVMSSGLLELRVDPKVELYAFTFG